MVLFVISHVRSWLALPAGSVSSSSIFQIFYIKKKIYIYKLGEAHPADRLQTARVAGGEEGSAVVTAHRKIVAVVTGAVVMATRQHGLR